MNDKRIWQRAAILTAVIGVLWLGVGRVIAKQQSDEDATSRALKRLSMIGKKAESPTELIITSEDFPREVGRKMTYTCLGCDGKSRERTYITTAKIPLGDITWYRSDRIVDGKSEPEKYLKKTKEALEFYPHYPLTGAELPEEKIRFPLRRGTNYEYQSSHGKVKVRVEGVEQVTVPAGKFNCLVYTRELEGHSVLGKSRSWIAPGVGRVKVVASCHPQADAEQLIMTLIDIKTDEHFTSEPNAAKESESPLPSKEGRHAAIGREDRSATELIITSEDFPLEVGRKVTWTGSGADGKRRNPGWAIFRKILLGDTTLYKGVVIVDGKSEPELYIKKTKESVEFYPSSGAETPYPKIAFPLRKGATYEYQSFYGKVKARVEGPEEVEVPVGKFNCLIDIQELEGPGAPEISKRWIAPGIGEIKAIHQRNQRESTWLVTDIQTGARSASEPGAVLLSNFDFGDPFVPPLFPKSRWKAGKGEKGAFSACEIDPIDGANRTVFSLKWTYHTKGTWVNVGLLLSGSWNESVDLSQYNSISFYIKGLTERICSFKIQSAPWREKVLTGAEIPIKLSSEWQKVVIDLKTNSKLGDIDITKTFTIGFVDWDKEYASNVVWIDEVMLHRTNTANGERSADKKLQGENILTR